MPSRSELRQFLMENVPEERDSTSRMINTLSGVLDNHLPVSALLNEVAPATPMTLAERAVKKGLDGTGGLKDIIQINRVDKIKNKDGSLNEEKMVELDGKTSLQDIIVDRFDGTTETAEERRVRLGMEVGEPLLEDWQKLWGAHAFDNYGRKREIVPDYE